MKILFVCTHNRCRSILSEAICNHVAGSTIEAFSAGSAPSGIVHPLALENLKMRGISIEGLQSQSWDEYSDADIDAVVTLCDSAAGEACPLWMGTAVKAHWGMPDPSAISGSDEQVAAAFASVISVLEQRLHVLATAVSKPEFSDLKQALNNAALEHPAPQF